MMKETITTNTETGIDAAVARNTEADHLRHVHKNIARRIGARVENLNMIGHAHHDIVREETTENGRIGDTAVLNMHGTMHINGKCSIAIHPMTIHHHQHITGAGEIAHRDTRLHIGMSDDMKKGLNINEAVNSIGMSTMSAKERVVAAEMHGATVTKDEGAVATEADTTTATTDHAAPLAATSETASSMMREIGDRNHR